MTAAAAIGGGLCIALPWLPDNAPRSLPPLWGSSSRTFAMVVVAAARIDDACRRGDAAAFAALTTERYRRQVEAMLAASGRRLDGDGLRQQRGHLGDLRLLDFVAGAASDTAAAVVLGRPRLRLGTEAGRQALLALRFAWDGHDLRLDRKVGRLLGAGESERGAGLDEARRLLDEE